MLDRESLARRILDDIRDGTDNTELMAGYEFSSEQLEAVLSELDEAGLIVKFDGRYIVPAMRNY